MLMIKKKHIWPSYTLLRSFTYLLNEGFGWELVNIVLDLYIQAWETLILHVITQASIESIVLVHGADIILCNVRGELSEFL
jgi:hypothetical protein